MDPGDKSADPVADTIELLLGTTRVEIDSKDDSGRTPLSHAAEMLNTSAVSALLKAGANPTLGDNDGKTSLSYANAASFEKQRQMHVIELLHHRAYVP